jgi:hypothetical protein
MANRRRFMKTLGAGVLGASSLPWGMQLAHASSNPNQKFIVCVFDGGWDTLLSIDPRNPAELIPTHGIDPGWDKINWAGLGLENKLHVTSGSPHQLGPAAAALLPHLEIMCALHGINMNTVTHEVGRRYFNTGEPTVGIRAVGSSFGTRIANAQGMTLPLPNLAIRNETFNEELPALASGISVQDPQSLQGILVPGSDSLDAELMAVVNQHRQQSHYCDTVGLSQKNQFGQWLNVQQKASQLLSSGYGDLFDFNGSSTEMTAIRDRYQLNTNTESGTMAAMAYQAIANNLSHAVTVRIAGGLDSHTNLWNVEQPQRLHNGFTALSQLLSDLRTTTDESGAMLIDSTTVIVTSEFSRTPKFNPASGKDHWATNSCLLFGAGIPQNQSFGASSEFGRRPQRVNPNTGAVDTEGVFLEPKRIYASLLASAGLDPSVLGNESEPLPFILA